MGWGDDTWNIDPWGNLPVDPAASFTDVAVLITRDEPVGVLLTREE